MHVNGLKLICPHCKGESFEHQQILLNTAGMTFFNLDWLNKNADTFYCKTCRRMEWFVDAQVTDGPHIEGTDCPRCGTFIEPGVLLCPNCGK